jgi:hypothetical protein
MPIDRDSFDQYCTDKKVCLRKTIKSKKCKSILKRDRCYSKYLSSCESKKEIEIDTKWEEARKLVLERDEHECRFSKVFTLEEVKLLDKSVLNDNNSLDICHVISRAQGKSDDLYYNPDNLFAGSRFFHNRLDQYKDLVTGKPMTKEMRNTWLIRIIGKETWDKLQKIYKGE